MQYKVESQIDGFNSSYKFKGLSNKFLSSIFLVLSLNIVNANNSVAQENDKQCKKEIVCDGEDGLVKVYNRIELDEDKKKLDDAVVLLYRKNPDEFFQKKDIIDRLYSDTTLSDEEKFHIALLLFPCEVQCNKEFLGRMKIDVELKKRYEFYNTLSSGVRHEDHKETFYEHEHENK